jgi:hypothetical protein
MKGHPMSDAPTRRGPILARNIFLIIALVLFIIAPFASKGSDLANFGTIPWLISGFISLTLAWLFPSAIV